MNVVIGQIETAKTEITTTTTGLIGNYFAVAIAPFNRGHPISLSAFSSFGSALRTILNLIITITCSAKATFI